jgi:hypothetical protein
MPKTPKEIADEEAAASREQREQLAREANKKRNDALLEARNAIADNADSVKTDEDELEPLTDEVWDQQDRPDNVRKKSRAELIAEQEAAEEAEANEGLTEEEAAARLLRAKEALDLELDEARDAGADDSRKNEDGEVEYRVEVNGAVKWLTLAALREQAGQPAGDAESRQRGKEGDTTHASRTPSPEVEHARREAEERRKTEKAALRAKLKDLNLRASMGDEQAIDELTDLQLEAIQGDSDGLLRKVDERVDARVGAVSDFRRAVDWFESEAGYARELGAPGFKDKAAAIDARIAQEQPNLTPRERLDLTGKELRKELKRMQEFFGVKGPADTGNGARPPDRQARLERKRNADQVPHAAGRTRPEVEPDEVQTTQDAIQQLARSRGQQRPISHKH